MAEIFRTAFITLISQKSLKALGKKDYADIIKFVGLSIVLLQCYFLFQRGFVTRTTGNSTWFMDWIGKITDVIVNKVKILK